MTKPVYFPLFVDISQKNFLVIGGGKIALRRVLTLLGFTNQIRIVSPELNQELAVLIEENHLCWEEQQYATEVLKDADYVLAATNDTDCNEQIVEDCRERRIPVNASHRKELCDFYFPSVVQKDHLVVGICGSGLNHSLVKNTRIQIENVLQSEDISFYEK